MSGLAHNMAEKNDTIARITARVTKKLSQLRRLPLIVYPYHRFLVYANMKQVCLTVETRLKIHAQQGLTIVEMMIGLAIVSILISVVAPNLQSILQSNRVAAEINTLSSAAQLARFRAIDDETSVVLCPTTDFKACVSSWSQAKMVFVDDNGNGAKEDAEVLVLATDAMSANVKVLGVSGSLVFADDGSIAPSADIVICPQSGTVENASALFISGYGRISVAVDSDNDGVKETTAGAKLACS